MTQYPQTDSTAVSGTDDFAPRVTEQSVGLTAEFLLFLKWWVVPIVVMLLGVGVLVIGGMALASFLYTSF